ncbi:G-protein coupled receptor Mth2-like [Palaemon carinicauda]|uniref:G-protein coupled receptor Mth2-like n=1 Tax=Palaemon carinicauda TaxID=392227 RepID=UPI0035B58B49
MDVPALLFTSVILTWETLVNGSQDRKSLVIRKCCAENEYYNFVTGECEWTDDTKFEDHVITYPRDNVTHISYKTGMIHKCPKSNQPMVTHMQQDTHVIIETGHLQELESGVIYDHDIYCTERIASSPNNLPSATLLVAFCPRTSKCCNIDDYPLSSFHECKDHLENIDSYDDIIQEFLQSGNVSTDLISESSGSLKIINSNATCFEGRNETTFLCKQTDCTCHPTVACCKDFFGRQSGAFICQNIFKKCCNTNEIWSVNGCISMSTDYLPSSVMTELLKTHFPKTKLPKLDNTICSTSFKAGNKYISWRVSDGVNLSVHTDYGSLETDNYCVEDYADSSGKIDSMVILCLREIAHILPEQILDSYSEASSIGKCCPERMVFNEISYCANDTIGLDILDLPEFVAANVTDITVSYFPVCQDDDKIYYIFPFGKQIDKDYAILEEDQTMSIVTLDHNCFFEKKAFRKTDYCIDYRITNGSSKPEVYLCSHVHHRHSLKHQEKYIIIPAFLGVSCAALIVTALSLMSMRVRRGIYTVKKMSTLPGKILLSYVFSYLMAFSLLAIGMAQTKGDDDFPSPVLLTIGMMKTTRANHYSCPLLAGMTLFFLLAAFQWNTSICLEHLLLTLDVKLSDNWRFLCHSLWAWGTPSIIMILALVLDYHRASLPCSVITPKIGLRNCFFSDPRAQILYLYLPMFISLCANITLLAVSKYVREAKLKKLERGTKSFSTSATSEERRQTSSSLKRQNSGLRKYKKNRLWINSTKLIFWAGATWIAEVASFLAAYLVGVPERWYSYLWYVPAVINALRGVSIFSLVVFTRENRRKLSEKVEVLYPQVASMKKSFQSRAKRNSISLDTVQKGEQNTCSEPTISSPEMKITTTRL